MVEFIFLGVLLLIPVVYAILTVSQLQAAAFAAVGAAAAAARALRHEGRAARPEEVAGRGCGPCQVPGTQGAVTRAVRVARPVGTPGGGADRGGSK